MGEYDWREEFHVPGPGPYVLSHSVGCLVRASANALEQDYLTPWRDRGGGAWPAWLECIDRFRESLASLLGGHAADYCPQANLSSGLAKLLSALPPPAPNRRVLLASEHSFASMVFALEKARGYRVRLMAADESPGRLDTWQRALSEDVCAVLITHVHSNTGVVAPVAQIAGQCRAQGIVSIVDVAQSAGVLPLDVALLGADVVLGSCVKWLCGGPGAGFMWLRPSLVQSLTPSDVGWFSHADPFEFDPHHFEYAADALRFWGGTPAIAPFVMATPSIRLLSRIGIDTIRSRNLGLQRVLAAAIEPKGAFDCSALASGGTSCISLGPHRAAVECALEQRGVRYDLRNDVLRVSFHVYNDEADAQQVGAALNAATQA